MQDASDIMDQLIGEDEAAAGPANSALPRSESSQGNSISVVESIRDTQTNQVGAQRQCALLYE